MKTAVKRKPAARPGRLPRELAEKVDARILDAAEQVFLKRGFAGATVDEVAEVAHAGKTTIYSRYPSKKDLFAAVLLRNVSDLLQLSESSPQGATMEARLQNLGSKIVSRAMSHKTIDLFRVTLAEAERFPDIACQVSQLARERGIDEVARLLRDLDDAPGARGQAEEAKIFMDLVVLPMVMRRLFGESLTILQAEVARHVADRVAFFLAASKTRRPAQEEA
jgi:AcrR family transcriptional regulator